MFHAPLVIRFIDLTGKSEKEICELSKSIENGEGFVQSLEEKIRANSSCIQQNIKDFFTAWIDNVGIEGRFCNRYLINNVYSQFLNFNYTDTLEKLYNIKNVNHIHRRENGEANIAYDYIFGFKKEKENPLKGFGYHGLKKIFEQANLLYKPVSEVICNDKVNYNDIDEIFFWGFALSEVDELYITKIIENNYNKISKIKLCKHQYDSTEDYAKFINFMYKNKLSVELECFDDELWVPFIQSK